MHRIISVLSILTLIIALFPQTVPAAGTSIGGVIKDAKTGEPLLGANIILLGTGKGASTDPDGKYNIPNVLPGDYKMKVSYIGYLEQNLPITVKEGVRFVKDFKLDPVGIEGQEIVVTAQAEGQTEAINQQLSSIQIMNVISSAKIQELPGCITHGSTHVEAVINLRELMRIWFDESLKNGIEIPESKIPLDSLQLLEDQ